MDPLFFGLAATCALGPVHSQVRAADGGWEERLQVDVRDEGDCDELVVALPFGVDLRDAGARVRFADGPAAVIDPRRWERLPRDLAGVGGARLDLPELHPHGSVRLNLVRVWPYDPAAPVPVQAPPALAPTHMDRVDTLVAPPIDVQRALYPGGGSWIATTVTLEFPASELASRWVVQRPVGASEVELPDGGVLQPDAVLLDLPPAAATRSLAVSWRAEDAPVHGLVPVGPIPSDYDVVAREGTVRWEHQAGAWWLFELHGQPVLPGRDELVWALDRRFGDASLPEPGLPASLRGRSVDWDTVGDALADLRTRVTIAPLPLDPLRPARLVRARSNRIMTPLEAVLTLRAQLRQEQVEAHWLLVRPANTGVGGSVSPAGYTDALLAVTLDGETRWVDPGCRSCATFELRPELEGASYLGYGATPVASPGSAVVRCDPGAFTCDVTLTGAAAVDLRQWTRDVPAAERNHALAARYDAYVEDSGGVAALEGFEHAGSPVHLALSGVRAPAAPVVPASLPNGGVWWPWRGLLEWPSPGEDVNVERPAFSLRREAGVLRLRVAERQWTVADWAAYDAVFHADPSLGLP